MNIAAYIALYRTLLSVEFRKVMAPGKKLSLNLFLKSVPFLMHLLQLTAGSNYDLNFDIMRRIKYEQNKRMDGWMDSFISMAEASTGLTR